MASVWRAARSTGFVVGLTIVVVAAAGAMLTIVHSNSAAKQQQLVVSNYDTISAMRRTLIALQDAELGQRAYLLTGNNANLEPYERARLRIDTLVRQLEATAAGDPDARRQIAEFRVAAGDKLDELNGYLERVGEDGPEAGVRASLLFGIAYHELLLEAIERFLATQAATGSS